MMKKLLLLCAALLLVAAPAMAGKAVIGQPAPDFALTDLEGKDFKLSEMKDKKAVVLSIMQTACSSCKDELKRLQEFVGKSDKYEILAINVDARSASPGWADNVKAYMAEMELTMRMAPDPKFSVGRLYGVGATPTMIVVDKEGKLTQLITGFTPGESEAELAKILNSLK